MLPFPHTYTASATVHPSGDALVASPRLTPHASAPAAEFGGNGHQWSPEALVIGAVADCFVLTFRAVADAAHFPWQSITCEVTGRLDRVPEGARFTELHVRARLGVADMELMDRGNVLLHRTERHCVLTRSLHATTTLEAEVHLAEPAAWMV